LGLAIIKKLLEMLDSSIDVDSEVGKGSTFHFAIWIEKSNVHEIDSSRSLEKKEDLGGAKILLVEDVEFNALLARKMLTNWNASVTLAENGAVAVEKVKNERFDLILMDVQMPVMDGLTASAEIRKFNKDIPIFPLTASTSANMQEEFMTIGIVEFIFKPINPDNLHNTIFKFINSSSAIG
jgi:CheY-like chemotaxis protein